MCQQYPTNVRRMVTDGAVKYVTDLWIVRDLEGRSVVRAFVVDGYRNAVIFIRIT